MADERDPKLSRQYRELEPLEPPPALDQKILAAARVAAESPHAPLVAPAGRHRWYYSLAAAAVLVFAVALTLQLDRDRPDPEMLAPAVRGEIKQPPKAEAPPPAQPEPAPAFTPDPQASAPHEPAAPPPRAADEARAASERKAAAETSARRDTAKQQAPSTARSRTSAAPGLQDSGASAQQNVDVLAARREAAAAQRVAPAPVPAQVAAAPENPERWLERIVELRSRGRHVDADRELAAFRRAYPGYQLSDVMRERVEGTPAPSAQ